MVCTGILDPKLSIHSFQVLQLLIPVPVTIEMHCAAAATNQMHYACILLHNSCGVDYRRKVFIAIITRVLKFSPAQVTSHSNQQLYTCNPSALNTATIFSWSQWVTSHTHKIVASRKAEYHQNEYCRVCGESPEIGSLFSCQDHADKIAQTIPP